MHVIAHGLEIPRSTAIHNQRLVTPAEQVPKHLVPPIESAGICPQEPFHATHQVGLRRLDDQVKMIAHQTPRVEKLSCFLAGFTEGLQKTVAAGVVLEDRLAPIASIHDVVDRPGVLNAQLSCHDRRLTTPTAVINTTLLGTDPFPATQLAAEEMDRLVTEWFAEVLQSPQAKADQTLSTRGRLALLLADMPGKWQEQFLRPGPWPEEFTAAMRESFLRAGPDFQLSKMTPRPLDLGPLTTLTNFGKLPYVRMALVWGGFALLLIVIFWLTHGGFGEVKSRLQLLIEWFKQNG